MQKVKRITIFSECQKLTPYLKVYSSAIIIITKHIKGEKKTIIGSKQYNTEIIWKHCQS